MTSIDPFRTRQACTRRQRCEDKAGTEKGAGAFFYRHVNDIFIEFKSLSPEEIKKFRTMFLTNNNIQALCEGRLSPFRYQVGSTEPLQTKIEKFFSKLYGSGFFNLKDVKDNIGADLHDHYRVFAKANGMPCCPFCGLQPMDTEYDPTRELMTISASSVIRLTR
jgi:hypothetical protein